MKKYGIIAAVVVVVAAIALGVMMLGGSKDVASSLPQNLTMVGRVDLKSMARQYGMDIKDAGAVLNSFLRFKADDETGVDYLNPTYVFASQGYFGGIIPLDDAEEFEAYLTKNANCQFESQRGFQWALLGENNILLAVAEDRAMLMGPAVGSQLDALRGTLAECLKQSESESGKQSPLYAMLDKREEPLVVATSFDALPEQIQPEPLRKEFDLSKLRALAGLSLTKSKVELSLTLESDDKKANQLFDQLDEALQPINGSLLKTAFAKPMAHMEMGVNGEKLLEMLRSIPEIRTKLLLANTIFDADLILKDIKGDLALSYTNDILMSQEKYILQAQLKDERFLKNVDSWNDELSKAAGVRFETADSKSGSILYKDEAPMYYAVREQVLRLSKDRTTANAEAHNEVAYAWEKEMKANRLYATIDASKILMLKFYLSNLERITLMMPEARQWNLKLEAAEGKELVKF